MPDPERRELVVEMRGRKPVMHPQGRHGSRKGATGAKKGEATLLFDRRESFRHNLCETHLPPQFFVA